MKKVKAYNLVSQKSWDLVSQNPSKLDWNEGDFSLSDKVKADIIDFINNRPLNWYPRLLDEAIIEGLLSIEHDSINSSMIQYFPGSDSIHRTVVNCFLKPHNTVLIIKPSYDNFRYVCEINSIVIKYFTLNEDGVLDFEELNNAITSDINLVYFVNPNNPTGIAYSISKLKFLMKSNLNTKFLIDEAYSDFWGHTLVSSVKEHSNAIITKTMSKSFGLAGFRFGYCVASEEIINQLNYFRNPKDINTLALVAVNSSIKEIHVVKKYIAEVKVEREKFEKLIAAFMWVSCQFDSKANFLLLKFSSEKIKLELIDHLLAQNIFVRNFDELFDSNCYLRISIGSNMTMTKLTKAFTEFSSSYE